jgi:hypothetical protein
MSKSILIYIDCCNKLADVESKERMKQVFSLQQEAMLHFRLVSIP